VFVCLYDCVFVCLCVCVFCVCVFVVHVYVPPKKYIRIHTHTNALQNIQTHTVYTNTHAERKAFLSAELDGLVYTLCVCVCVCLCVRGAYVCSYICIYVLCVSACACVCLCVCVFYMLDWQKV